MPGSVPSVRGAIRILQHLAIAERARARELSTALALNPSTTHSILKTMVAGGMLDFDESTKLYRLGPWLRALGAAAWEAPSRASAAMPVFEEWVARTGLAIFMAERLPSNEILVVQKVDSTATIRVTVDLGYRFPITAPALGKAFLAWTDPAEVDRILMDVSLPSYTSNSIISPEAMRAELDLVRSQGWSRSRGEYFSGNNAVAAPVFDPHGRVACVICSLGPHDRMPDESLPRLGRELIVLAERVAQVVSPTDRLRAEARLVGGR